MSSPSSSRLLVLGPSQGWHADQLASAAKALGHRIEFASYESLDASIGNQVSAGLVSAGLGSECSGLDQGTGLDQDTADCSGSRCVEVRISRSEDSSSQRNAKFTDYDAVLVRTMPAASLEKITFRLACLHAVHDGIVHDGITRQASAMQRRSPKRVAVVNPPRGLEWAIDKFATLARLSAAGFATPPTYFCQSREQAMEAFERFGGDCVVKPMLGGEGRGVMRICDTQLAWTTFSTLDRLDTVLQVQKFIAPGGKDRRYLVIGDRVFGVRRDNPSSFRSNVSAGGQSSLMTVEPAEQANAKRITQMLGLTIASVDQIDNADGEPMYLEVNAIPGWKGAQQVVSTSIAREMIQAILDVVEQTSARVNFDDQSCRPNELLIPEKSTPQADRAPQR